MTYTCRVLRNCITRTYIYKVGTCPICFSPCLRCEYSCDEIDPIIALKHRRGRQLVETSSIDNNIVTTTLAKEGIKPTRSVRVATVAALKLIGKVAMSEDILEKGEKDEKKERFKQSFVAIRPSF